MWLCVLVCCKWLRIFLSTLAYTLFLSVYVFVCLLWAYVLWPSALISKYNCAYCIWLALYSWHADIRTHTQRETERQREKERWKSVGKPWLCIDGKRQAMREEKKEEQHNNMIHAHSVRNMPMLLIYAATHYQYTPKWKETVDEFYPIHNSHTHSLSLWLLRRECRLKQMNCLVLDANAARFMVHN